ncbi:MAG: hypothetical protein J0J04_08120 [Microbacterium sp.]|uniref:hypothetical protein n=1 Tax=Microbacterium sp. TaxID=51671 RepID=UPI001ACE0213|nr:hypothetical protein [Microbacterium sp.]MBN9214766.1 hypothetical protein [Microbacterium sp.]
MKLSLRGHADTQGLTTPAVHDRLHRILLDASLERPSRNGYNEAAGELEWVLHERATMLAEVNRIRAERGVGPVDEAAIMDAEQPALGHVDYSSKFALYCSELALSPGDTRAA